jgi:hypothetical protein
MDAAKMTTLSTRRNITVMGFPQTQCYLAIDLDMQPTRKESNPRLWKGLLTLAAVDAAVAGAWAVCRPTDLFALLQQAPSDDGLLLCRLLGLLYLTQAAFLLLAAFLPGRAGLAWAPLLGRLLSCGLWLWLLGSARFGTTVGVLLAHDAVWPPLLTAFLWTRRTRRPIPREASTGPGFPATPPAPPA